MRKFDPNFGKSWLRQLVCVCMVMTVFSAPLAAEEAFLDYEALQDQPEAEAPTDGETPDDLTDLGLEQLSQQPVLAPAFQQEVSIVTGQQSTVGKSPAAVFVVTQEMIRRSGSTSIPETLRMVPGLQVARVNSHEWSVTARGFANNIVGLFATNNKLLVQIDGRTVYSPVSSGVHWDVQDVILDDIERIEVVRGPGATIWGANAVNGVINIITKRAEDTQGGLVNAGGGTEENGFTNARFGGQLGEDAYYRVYGKWFERGQFPNLSGTDFDDWRQERGGFRIGWTPSDCDTVTFQGDIYNGSEGLTLSSGKTSGGEPDLAVQGGNLLLRWDRALADDENFSMQFYYDRADRSNTDILLDQEVTTYDASLQHNFSLNSCQDIVWGLGFRSVQDQMTPLIDPAFIAFDPSSRTYDRLSGFVQDEIELVPDSLTALVGIKLLTSEMASFEYQPSARLIWSPESDWAAWGSISRAVRTPSRVDHDLFAPNTTDPSDPPELEFQNSFLSEDMIAYELGYRAQPAESFSWDAAVFFNQYEHLASSHLIPVSGTPGVQFINGNQNRGYGYGVELSAQADVNPCWHISGWYSFLQLDVHPTGPLAPSGSSGKGENVEGSSPHHQAFIMSTYDLTCDVELDLMARYVDSLPFQGVSSYISMDARLGWHLSSNTELSVVGQNLLDNDHIEFGGALSSAVPRGVYCKMTLRW